MKMTDIKKIIPLKKDELFRPLEELSEKDKESIYYCDLADSTL